MLKHIKAILLSIVILSIILACLLVKSERLYTGGGDMYSITNILAVRLLSHSNGGNVPVFSPIDMSFDKTLKIYNLTSHQSNYTLVVYSDKIKIYSHGKCISEYKTDRGMKILSSFIADYDNDGNDNVFLLLKKEEEAYGERLIILYFDGKNVNKTYDESFEKVNPWKVQVSDVDGDGVKEISLGVYTVAKYHPVFAKRPFIYYFHDNKLYPKWLGSRLSRPFDDYVFCDMDSDKTDELVSIELNSDGRKELNAYKWKGFGFESIGTSKAYDDIYDIKAEGSTITAVCKDKNTKDHKIFKYNNGRIE